MLRQMKAALKKLRVSYTKRVMLNCIGTNTERGRLAYWQNRLFGSILLYLLPLILVAVILGIIMSLKSGMIFLVVFDALVVVLLAFITFSESLHVSVRKDIFITVLYSAAIVLL